MLQFLCKPPLTCTACQLPCQGREQKAGVQQENNQLAEK